MPISLRAAGLGLAVLLACASAPAEPAAELTPPTAESSTDVPYPAGAEGDATVELDLVVETDGSVCLESVVGARRKVGGRAGAARADRASKRPTQPRWRGKCHCRRSVQRRGFE